jgi:zinc finger FYVE domain-containing protein 26
MFRHGHYNDACLLFFPANAMPASPQPFVHQTLTPSSSPQRPDSLATDYGTIDELCDLCIGYGAMPVLEHVIAIRNVGSSTQDTLVSQYTAAALTRICNYCETHRHFNHLYRFQVCFSLFN